MAYRLDNPCRLKREDGADGNLVYSLMMMLEGLWDKHTAHRWTDVPVSKAPRVNSATSFYPGVSERGTVSPNDVDTVILSLHMIKCQRTTLEAMTHKNTTHTLSHT